MKPGTLPALGLAALLTATACRDAASAPVVSPPASGPARAAVTGGRRLVFFMNPNGRPCQLQDQILRGMAAELEGRAQLVYYRTTEPGELGYFQQYGVRSLPLLVVTDAGGAELRRAPPGIQDEAQVRALLGP